MRPASLAAVLTSLATIAASGSRAAPADLAQVVTAPAPSEPQDTLIKGEIEHGGYGGPRVSFGRIDGHDAVHVGGEGGWIVNHRFILGGAGYGLVTEQPAPGEMGSTQDLTMGYGGLMLGYTLAPQRVVHATFTALIGAGGLGARMRSSGSHMDLGDAFFVVEPTATLDVNVATHFRAGFAVSYRFISGVNTDGLSSSDLGGVFGSMVLKFGKF